VKAEGSVTEPDAWITDTSHARVAAEPGLEGERQVSSVEEEDCTSQGRSHTVMFLELSELNPCPVRVMRVPPP
jgi:hypothetical protein